jgi:cytochrome b pre-mRNA-processing protein 3
MLAASTGASLMGHRRNRNAAKDAMLRFLFRTLTAQPERGAKLFAAASDEARRSHWYSEGGVPDTIDGRFAMLATILALILVRVEREGDEGNVASVELTERFIEVMESEHRELGLGDPTLGKTVRKLVGSLARRTELWRSATGGQSDWDDAVRESLRLADPTGLAHDSAALREFWLMLERKELGELMEGTLR